MTTDVSGGEITSQAANDQGAGQCPCLTRVCATALGDSFFAHFSLLSLTFSCSIPWLSPSPKPFSSFKSVVFERHSSYPDSIFLFA